MRISYTLILVLIPFWLLGQQTRIESITYGDSLRIDIKILGDTIYKTFVDLRGTSDDDFDGTYDVKLYYTFRSSKDSSEILNSAVFDFGYCRFLLAKRDILNFNSNQLKQFTSETPKGVIIEKTKQLSKLQNEITIDTTDNYKGYKYILPDLIKTMDFNLKVPYKTDIYNKVRIEDYETGFSGGYWLEFINSNNQDTIKIFKVQNWIR